MTIDKLAPAPAKREKFRHSSLRFVPETAGCYVLTTFESVVLYIGQAVNIRRRMSDHLDDPRKTGLTPQGRAFFFYWLEYESIGKLERTWLNIHGEYEPRYPILNIVNSPVST
jgi:excinuclease UvrABC nuclease subunit